MHTPRNVAIFIFDQVELLDFAGPFEVFSRTRLTPGLESRRDEASAPFRVVTVAEHAAPVTATGGVQIIPAHDFASAGPIDLLVIPGGWGTRPLLEHRPVIEWIRRTAGGASGSAAPGSAAPGNAAFADAAMGDAAFAGAMSDAIVPNALPSAPLVTSVCSGALLLARAGLLQGRRATTHWGALDALAALDASIAVQRETRVVHDGVITSAGISAGIDMALEVVERLHGKAVADDTAHYMEYVRGR